MKNLKVLYSILHEGGIKYLYYRILEVKFWKNYNQKEWSKAIKVGEKVGDYFCNNKILNIRLAECYQNINEKRIAFNIFQKTMKLNFNLIDTVEKIDNKLSLYGSNPISSKFILLNGNQNYGFIEHITQDQNGKTVTFLTKISKLDNNREFLFYKHFYSKVYKITPRLVNIHSVNSDICLITTKKINSRMINFNFELLNSVIELNHQLSSIKYRDISDLISIEKLEQKTLKLIDDFSLEYPMRTLHYFSSIHKMSTNKSLFEEIFERMKKLSYSSESISSMKRVEEIIFIKKLYQHINPKIHYSVLHGDLNLENILIDENNQLYFIDWGQMRVGPTWIDMAGFLGILKVPFKQIDNWYLCNSCHNNAIDALYKVFFIYSIIVYWFLLFTKEEFEANFNLYISPAVKKLELVGLEVLNDKQKSLI